MLQRMLKPFVLLAFLLNTLLLLLALLAHYISPLQAWPIAIFGLLFKLFLGVHLLFLLLFLLGRSWKLSIACILILLLCLPALRRTYAFGEAQTGENGKTFRVMTYNVHCIGYYSSQPHTDTIINNIAQEKPDIVCLQEYHVNPGKYERFDRELMKAGGFRYKYFFINRENVKDNRTGLAVFSKVKCRNVTDLPFRNTRSNAAFYMDLPFGKDTVRLINAHFQSIGLREDEYELPEETDENGKEQVKKYELSLKKIRKAFLRRTSQAEEVRDVIDASPYPLILCGDFNDTPDSYLYGLLTQKLDDSFLKGGQGLGSTFAGKIPFIRIDYILASPGIAVKQSRVVYPRGSDHYPVVTDLYLP